MTKKTHTVYVVQNTMTYNKASGEFVPKFNLEAAEEYGELKFLLTPTASPFRVDSVVPDIETGLAEMTEDDYILLIGSPALIGLVTAIAADITQGNFKFLQWSGRDLRYTPIIIKGLFSN